NAEYLKSLAWQRYQLAKDLDEAELHLRRAVELEPDNIDFARAHASTLMKRGRWDEAIVVARRFISEEDDLSHEWNWPDIVRFFHDAVTSGHTKEAIVFLDEMEYGQRWRPLREALQAIAEDDSNYLLRIAPEVRQPAEEIVAMLLAEGVKLGG